MSDVDICLNSMEDVIDFVKCTGKQPFNMDLVNGNNMVDAKSLLGVLDMAMGKKVQLRIYEEQAEDLIQEIRPFISEEQL